MQLIEARNFFRDALKEFYPINEADYYFKMILPVLFGIDPIDLALSPKHTFNVIQQNKLKSVITDLLNQKPIQYILGEIYFRKIVLKVNPKVLIPRPETEELVDWILDDYSQLEHEISVLDLGTGSGCIALSLKKEQAFFKVHALDLDVSILEVVKRNAEWNTLDINCIQADMRALDSVELEVEIIVSNPPYITPKEKKAMKKNVLEFEPHQALFVPQDDPLLFYRKILIFAKKKLKPKGRIYLEINPLFESELEALIFNFESYNITKRLDIFGKIRMFRLEKI
jgi:release factor glutamine methyltransferase